MIDSLIKINEQKKPTKHQDGNRNMARKLKLDATLMNATDKF
jgi:hypothetical protein